jgi:hypothetical protein
MSYPCSTVLEQSQNGFARRRPEKPLRKLLRRPKTPSQKPGKPKEASEVNDNSMKAGFLDDLEKAKQTQSTAKGTMTAATSKMFTFYLN